MKLQEKINSLEKKRIALKEKIEKDTKKLQDLEIQYYVLKGKLAEQKEENNINSFEHEQSD